MEKPDIFTLCSHPLGSRRREHPLTALEELAGASILERIEKGATVAQLELGAQRLANRGIARSVGFVIGLPGETDETVDESIALAKRVRPERLQFTRFTPLPGTPLAQLGTSAGFHAAGDDTVAAWIERCYAECGGQWWGAESW